MADTTPLPSKISFHYFKIANQVIDPTDIEQLNIYESLDFPGITGNIVLKDFGDLKDRADVFAGDNIEFSLYRIQDDDVPPMTIKMPIYKSYGDTPNEGQISNTITFGFCDAWLIEAFTVKRSRSWTNRTVSYIVGSLVAECLGYTEDDWSASGSPVEYLQELGEFGWWPETNQTLERFVSPFWTPMETIQYLTKLAVTDPTQAGSYSPAEAGGFVMWTDIYNAESESKTINFAPLGWLMTTDNSYEDVPFKLEMVTTHDQSAKKVYQMSMEQSFDIIKYADVGLGRSRLIGFDYDRSEVMYSDRRIDIYEQNHLSHKLPLNQKYLGPKYRKTKSSFAYPNTTKVITGSDNTTPYGEIFFPPKARDMMSGQLMSKMTYMFSDMLKLNAMTQGEAFSKRVGCLVEVLYPSVDQTVGGNKQYSGWYLIRNNRHVIQGMAYANMLTLVTDGLKEIDRDDLVQWNVVNDDSEGAGDVQDADRTVETAAETEVTENYGDYGILPWFYGDSDESMMGGT